MKNIHRKELVLFGLGILFCCLCFGVFFLGKALFAPSSNEKQNASKQEIVEEEEQLHQEEQSQEESSSKSTNDSTQTEASHENQPSTPSASSQGTTSSESANIEITPSEASVISYFQEQEQLVNNGHESDTSLIEKVKTGFHTIYQFLFEGGTIQGYTFCSLSAKAKLQVLKIALTIDNKIDTLFPNYKAKIKSGVSNLKTKAIAKYLEVTAKICESYPDTCTQAREDFKNMKQSFGFTFSMIKDLFKEGSSALKEWYNS